MFNKGIINEVKRIQKLMGLNESSEVVKEFENTQEASECSFYDDLNPPEGVDYFFQTKLKNMNYDQKQKIFSKIQNFADLKFLEAKQYYQKTYSSGDGYDKLYENFAIGENKEKNIENLLNYVDNANLKIYFNLSDMPVMFRGFSNAWAFTQLNNVYVNIFNFWDGTVGGKKSLHDALIHELNHVLQNYMLNNPNEFSSPFYDVSKETNPVVKSKEMHSYLQTFRYMFNISVTDDEEVFLQKIKNKVDDNSIKWDFGDIKYIDGNLVFFKKQNGTTVDFNISTPEHFRENMMYRLHYDDSSGDSDERIGDMTFLFSNYVTFGKFDKFFTNGEYPNVKVAVVNLKDIAKINLDFVMNGIETGNQKI